jgi:hypothetical protein
MITLAKPTAKRQRIGVVLYHGPSLIDGAPIVVVATGLGRPSRNAKTGAMAQTFILRADQHPIDALQSGADVSVCGDCPLRGLLGDGSGRGCYVNVGQSPSMVWHAWRRGAYREFSPMRDLPLFRRRPLRCGAYGEPVAAPFELWRVLTNAAPKWTGYTHQWRRPQFSQFKALLMASVESEREALQAQRLGWRTFRSGSPDSPIGKPLVQLGELGCPAAPENGSRVTCAVCGLCAGADHNSPKSVYIDAHGSPSTLSSYSSLDLGD